MMLLDLVIFIIFIICAVIINECDMTIEREKRYLRVTNACALYAFLRLIGVL